MIGLNVSAGPPESPDEVGHQTILDAEGSAFVTFSIGGNEVTLAVDDYPSGQEMKKAALSWGRQYGARRVRD